MSGLEAFFERFRRVSPLASGHLDNPAEAIDNVASINEQALDALKDCARRTLRERRGKGAMVWGAPGSGKSHLLARLGRWSDRRTNDVERACLVHVPPPHGEPPTIPRYILGCVLRRLTAGAIEHFRDTTLYRIINRTVKDSVRRFPPPNDPPSSAESLAAYLKLAEQRLGDAASEQSPRVHEVLFRFFKAAYRAEHSHGKEGPARLALRWLMGDVLDPKEAAMVLQTPTPPDPPLGLLQSPQTIRNLLVSVGHHARDRKQPLILCFDHVDGLADAQMRALAVFLHAMLEEATNLVVVLAGDQHRLLDFAERGVIEPESWERLVECRANVEPIAPDQAKQILEMRLKAFQTSQQLSPEVMHLWDEDPLFPLGQAWFDRTLGAREQLRPRDVIAAGHRRWEQQQQRLAASNNRAWLNDWQRSDATAAVQPQSAGQVTGEQFDRHVAVYLSERAVAAQQNPDQLPTDARHLGGLVASVLRHAVAAQTSSVVEIGCLDPAAEPPETLPYQIILKQTDDVGFEESVGLVFVDTGSSMTTAEILRRLAFDFWPPCRVMVISDLRRPLRRTPRALESVEILRYRGNKRLRFIELDPAHYASLEALHAAVVRARCGDLDLSLPDGSTLPLGDAAVIGSLVRQQSYVNHPLVGVILTGEDPIAPPTPEAAAVQSPNGKEHPAEKPAPAATARAAAKSPSQPSPSAKPAPAPVASGNSDLEFDLPDDGSVVMTEGGEPAEAPEPPEAEEMELATDTDLAAVAPTATAKSARPDKSSQAKPAPQPAPAAVPEVEELELATDADLAAMAQTAAAKSAKPDKPSQPAPAPKPAPSAAPEEDELELATDADLAAMAQAAAAKSAKPDKPAPAPKPAPAAAPDLEELELATDADLAAMAEAAAAKTAKPAQPAPAPKPAAAKVDDSTGPPAAELRKFIEAELMKNFGMTTRDLAVKYLEDHPGVATVEAFTDRLGALAERLQSEGVLDSVKYADEMFLTLK